MPIHTRHGSLDETALEAFQDDFEPERILRAIEDLDRVKHGISAMQEELRELHRMAEGLMEIDPTQPNASVPDHESIWMLAEDISQELGNGLISLRLQRISLMKWQNLRQTLMQSGTTNRIAPFFD